MIGAGGRAIAGDGAGLAFGSEEKLFSRSRQTISAADVFRSLTGVKVSPGSIIHLSIEDMKKRSDSLKGGGVPGLLGEMLKNAGKKVSIVGNADSLVLAETAGANPSKSFPISLQEAVDNKSASLFSYVCHREAACAAIDRKGVVPSGETSTALVKFGHLTGLVSTDFEKLISVFKSEYATSDFITVDLGETSRVDEFSQIYSDAQIERRKRAALGKCDKALGEIMMTCDFSKDLLILCVPTPSRKMISETELLTPIFIWGPGFEEGCLSSPTTRKKGLITNIDVAPTILSFFGIEIPAEIEGKPASSIPTPESERALKSLLTMKNRAVFVANSRTTLFKIYVLPAIFILLICASLAIIRKDLVIGHDTFWSILILAVLAGPTAFSLTVAVPVNSLWFAIPAAIAAQLTIGSLAYCIYIPGYRKKKGSTSESRTLSRRFTQSKNPDTSSENNNVKDNRGTISALKDASIDETRETMVEKYRYILPRAVLSISFLTLFMVLIDPFVGTPFGSSSPFGALIVLGGRFYGIGNFFMGLAVASTITISAFLPSVIKDERIRAKPASRFLTSPLVFAAILFSITLAALGHPSLGANVGGVITVCFAGVVTLFSMSGRKISWKILIAAALFVLLILSLLFAFDLLLGGRSSHAGGFMTRLFGGKPGEALRVLGRKLMMNYLISLNSLWRFFALASIFALVVWERAFGIFRRTLEVFPAAQAALFGMLTAFPIALIFNDTGIEPASAILLFLASTFFLLSMPLTPARRPRAHPVT